MERRQIALAHEKIGGSGVGIDHDGLVKGILRPSKPGVIGTAFGSDLETRRMAQRTYANSSDQGKDSLFFASGVIFRALDCLESGHEISAVGLDQTGAGVGLRMMGIQSQGEFKFTPRIGEFFLVEQNGAGEGVMFRGIEPAQRLPRHRITGDHEDSYSQRRQKPERVFRFASADDHLLIS